MYLHLTAKLPWLWILDQYKRSQALERSIVNADPATYTQVIRAVGSAKISLYQHPPPIFEPLLGFLRYCRELHSDDEPDYDQARRLVGEAGSISTLPSPGD